jgi:hypothetical protein
LEISGAFNPFLSGKDRKKGKEKQKGKKREGEGKEMKKEKQSVNDLVLNKIIVVVHLKTPTTNDHHHQLLSFTSLWDCREKRCRLLLDCQVSTHHINKGRFGMSGG